ncbi:Septin-domain-containing protein [Neurospora tetraspora]|uniref:Septin-domain-containing protein n=1 Tax=Neurospora tetraspora TaxID=94610 RepID=A0AAE0MPU2_9PEZI|nr:Septin-domain-containing protein [Neurospora tetraspora]
MRSNNDASGRPRGSDNDIPSLRLPPAPQMTFCFGDESSVGPLTGNQPSSFAGPHRHLRDNKRKAHGVVEGSETHHGRARGLSHHRHNHHSTPEPEKETGASGSGSTRTQPKHQNKSYTPNQILDTLDHVIEDAVYPRPSSCTPSNDLSQAPFSPFLFSTGPASAVSDTSSRRNSICLSDDFDMASIPPSVHPDEIDIEHQNEHLDSTMMDIGSAPQLIMPSINMPSRRPFTDQGKSMGRLKVLIAGDSGVGKTSLIKAIVQSCEHIVHVDPITPSPMSPQPSLKSSVTLKGKQTKGGSRSSSRRQSSNGTGQITEVYASTKPYPQWWSEIDDLNVLKRRKSMEDTVLDRNICFVDTPGYGSGSSSMDTITPVVQYIESQMQRMNVNALNDGDMLNMLGGEGGVQIDVVFYLVSNRLRPVDIAYLDQLSPLTNIIFLLSHADLMSPEQISASKEQIQAQLREANIRPFSFSITPSKTASSSTLSPSPTDPAAQGVYAISSAAGSDHDMMDASLLMSTDYVEPLVPSELPRLVERVFSPDGASWLRHSAARKYVQWRKGLVPEKPAVPSPTSPSSVFSLSPSSHNSRPGTASSFLSRYNTSGPIGATSSYALARITDHTQREERLAQVRLANWATELQKSLANERAQYEALARNKRAVWLTEKIGECVVDGTLVPISSTSSSRSSRDRSGSNRSLSTRRRRGDTWQSIDRQQQQQEMGLFGFGYHHQGHHYRQHQHQHQHQQHRQKQRQRETDPLGLMEIADELMYKSLIALEVLGSLGVLGGLAIWMGRTMQLQPLEWFVGEWNRVWR